MYVLSHMYYVTNYTLYSLSLDNKKYKCVNSLDK